MGFITLEDGTTVHTQALNPNPVVSIEPIESISDGHMVTYAIFVYTYKDGTKQTITTSCSTYK